MHYQPSKLSAEMSAKIYAITENSLKALDITMVQVTPNIKLLMMEKSM